MKTSNPVVHFEIPAENKDRMVKFYETAFGWNAQRLGPEMGNYVIVKTTETDEKGMPKKPGIINGGLFEKT
ncbi:MAG TPA: VOC family protein, partial [Ignavibacteria bacterium]